MKRISITIPDELLAAADAKARALDRSRSWVIAESLRKDSNRESVPESSTHKRETHSNAYSAGTGLGESRQLQLEADLALTPEQRVIEAERTLMRSTRSDRPRLNRVLSFERYEDFLDWDRNERIRR